MFYIFVEQISCISWYENLLPSILFNQELNTHKDNDIVVIINSCGGDFFAAELIYCMLKSFRSKVTVRILDWACSAASLIAMSGDVVEISSTGRIVIHNPICENVDKNLFCVDDIVDDIVEIYQSKTSLSSDKIKQLMDVESCFNANEAVLFGFADKVVN